MKKIKFSNLLKFIAKSFIVLISIILLCDLWVEQSSKDKVFEDINDVPPKKVLLVLGTSKYLSNGEENLFFKYRIDAAEDLINNGKADFIIVSGDNSTKNYNETKDMKISLIERGISSERIFEDFAGFSTLDSVLRANLVFGQDDFIIVSQPFHNKRAIFIAQKSAIKAIAYNANTVSFKYSKKTYLREYLARVKAVIETVILNTKPKFYKQQEKLPI